MPKRKVTKETIARIQTLKRSGKNHSEIARELGLDRRTVKAAAEGIGRVLDQEHWEAVSRQVDVSLLERHYSDLLRLAEAVQERINRDLLDLNPEVDLAETGQPGPVRDSLDRRHWLHLLAR